MPTSPPGHCLQCTVLLQCKAYTQVTSSTLNTSAALYTPVNDLNFSKLWSLPKASFYLIIAVYGISFLSGSRQFTWTTYKTEHLSFPWIVFFSIILWVIETLQITFDYSFTPMISHTDPGQYQILVYRCHHSTCLTIVAVL